jgi:hypothetical protein
MAKFEFNLEFVTTETNPKGQPLSKIELVVQISDPIKGYLLYPMTVKYLDGQVLHDVQKVIKDIPNENLRRSLISNLKIFIKSLF